MKTITSVACILTALLALSQRGISQTATIYGTKPASPIGSLKAGPGLALVQANCIPCHSTALVAANHMSREQWDKTINTMQKVNGMWPVPAEIRERILDYLEQAQRVEDKGLDAGKQTPWAGPLYRPNPIWP